MTVKNEIIAINTGSVNPTFTQSDIVWDYPCPSPGDASYSFGVKQHLMSPGNLATSKPGFVSAIFGRVVLLPVI